MSKDIKLDYSSVLIVPQESEIVSRKDVDLNCEFEFKHSSQKWAGVPIVAANMAGVGTFSVAKKLFQYKMITFIAKFYSKEDWKDNFSEEMRNFVGVSTGISEKDINKSTEIFKEFGLKWICVDVANGYTTKFLSAIKEIRKVLGDSAIIVAGNVVTPEMTERIIKAGADIVKVGIGPGSVCTTRIQTGVGYPQLSAVIECSEAAEAIGGMVMADGGCTCPGDVSKSFCGGASFSMIGGMLAGHLESEANIVKKHFKTGEVIVKDDGTIEDVIDVRSFVSFYGMSSDTAMKNHGEGMKNYRSSEGRTVMVPLKESLDATILDLLGGIRSTCTYVGAKNLGQLYWNSSFVKVQNQFNPVFAK